MADHPFAISLPVLTGEPSEPGGARYRMTRSGDIAQFTAQIAGQLQSPRVVALELILTEACNLGCTYCFEYAADPKASMTSTTARLAIDFLLEASRGSDWVGVQFIGGEPMLCFDRIREIVPYAREEASKREKSIYFNMQTNGALIREEHARYFREQGVRYCLSLDGARITNDRHRRTLGGPGTFQIVAAKMKMLKRHQPWQGARMTVTPEDARALGENIRALHESLEINQFVIGFATHVEWSDDRIADYAAGLIDAFEYFLDQRVLRRGRRLRIGLFEIGGIDEAYAERGRNCWGCGAGGGRLAVSPDGTFHGCSKLAWGASGGGSKAPVPLGSVETGFSRPENRLKLLNHGDGPRVKCHSCEIAAHCNGGCYAANAADTGDIYVPADYFCKLMFAQKHACDHARGRVKELGLDNLFWRTDVPDLTDPREAAAHVFSDVH